MASRLVVVSATSLWTLRNCLPGTMYDEKKTVSVFVSEETSGAGLDTTRHHRSCSLTSISTVPIGCLTTIATAEIRQPVAHALFPVDLSRSQELQTAPSPGQPWQPELSTPSNSNQNHSAFLQLLCVKNKVVQFTDSSNLCVVELSKLFHISIFNHFQSIIPYRSFFPKICLSR